MFSTLYYEIHITIEPVFEERLELLKATTVGSGFKVANLLMQKRKEDTEQRSKYDTFMTAHTHNKDAALDLIIKVCDLLKKSGFKVWRYKIEDVILDSRNKDVLHLTKE